MSDHENLDPSLAMRDEEQPEVQRRPGRRPRARAERVDEHLAAEREANERDLTEDRELTDAERLEMFRDSRFQSVLPDLPRFPGYHVVWLTTTNARDSIQNRLRMGYRLIRMDECPGWEGGPKKVGTVDNVVGVNEMVAARIPLKLYNLYFNAAHHEGPLEEEIKLRSQADGLKREAEQLGAALDVGDGLETLGQRVRPKVMTE